MSKFKLKAGLLLCLPLGLVGLSSCGSIEVEPTNEVYIDASSMNVFVGKTLKLEAKVEGEKGEVTWRSSDESVASVDSTGLVKGLKLGEVEITCALVDNLNSKASVKLNVLSEGEEDVSSYKLTLNSLPNKTQFTQGTYFELLGLRVYKQALDANGMATGEKEEITDFSTNPKDQSYLSEVGSFSCVVSYPGAKSVTFGFNVVAAKDDLSLVNVLTKLDDTKKYVVETDASVELTTGTSVVQKKETFTEDAYYYKSGDTSYGYAGQSKIDGHKSGIFKFGYSLMGDVVGKEYLTHSYYDIWRYKALSKFDFLDPDLAPTRLVDGYFKYTSSDVVGDLLLYFGMSASNASSIQSCRVKVLDDSSFQVEMIFIQNLGHINYKVSEIDTATIDGIDAYLDADKGGGEVSKEVSDAIEALSKNNYTQELGAYNIGLGLTIDMGKVYYTEKYKYYDYTPEWMDYYNGAKEDTAPELKKYGYLKLENGDIHGFTVDFASGESTLKAEEEVLSTDSMSEYGNYLINADIFTDDYKDLLGSTSLNEKPAYLTFESSVAKDFANLTGEDTSSYTPYGVGIGGLTYEAEALKSMSVYYLFANGSSAYFKDYALSAFGTTKSVVVDDYLASLK